MGEVKQRAPYARGPWGPPYGDIMGELAQHPYSAFRLGRQLGFPREEMSRLLANLRRHGFVEHRGAWRTTEAGRAAIKAAESSHGA